MLTAVLPLHTSKLLFKKDCVSSKHGAELTTVHQCVRMIPTRLQIFLFSIFLFFRLFEAKFYLMETKQEGTDYALPQKEKKNVTVAFVLKSTGIDIIYHYIPRSSLGRLLFHWKFEITREGFKKQNGNF